ncbi:MAG: FHA domain-containing protein [Phoenicibacter congonensis]|uniref:FHA domain-containing protein n=1 Tax=Phoenicibacter congonensis TaxID=1944646 RepID=A0AA43RI77_9ACTN|nr:FHA domain-containing protein [Phoenicibacter congonensis]
MTTKCPVCDSEIQDGIESCPTCGFRLSGSTQQFKPVQIENAPAAPAAAIPEVATKTACIVVLSGITKGSKYELGRGPEPTTIGRDPKRNIFLNDMTVSRAHASIMFEQGEWIIRDEGSFNGVWVNNKSVETKVLQNNDIIQLGNFLLEFHCYVK